MKLENSALKESIIKMMQRRYSHTVVTLLEHFLLLVNQVKKKTFFSLLFFLLSIHVLVADFEVDLAGSLNHLCLFEKGSRITGINCGEGRGQCFVHTCITVVYLFLVCVSVFLLLPKLLSLLDAPVFVFML